jgi:uncharacterized protein involved in type VI secretion and phage assembly
MTVNLQEHETAGSRLFKQGHDELYRPGYRIRAADRASIDWDRDYFMQAVARSAKHPELAAQRQGDRFHSVSLEQVCPQLALLDLGKAQGNR